MGSPKDTGLGARLDSLTGLRFAAALAVLLFHIVSTYQFTPLIALRHVVLQGFVGVSFFFILSGFVLAWSHRQGDRISGFYRRRIARIGPLQVATWALVGVILVALGTPPIKKDALASLVLVVPWIPRLTFHLPMNGPSWSLGCELFFYALFPFVVAPLRRLSLRSRRVLALALVAAVVLVAVSTMPLTPQTTSYWFLYDFPPVRMLEFVFGGLLAFEVMDGTLPVLNLRLVSLLALGAYVADSWAPTSFEAVAVTLVPFGLLIVACAQTDLAGRPSLWRSRAMVTLGMWSFALYMIQATALLLIGHAIHRQLNDVESAMLAVGTVLVCVAAAGFLYTVVEHPLERWLRVVSFDSLRNLSPQRALEATRRRLTSMRRGWARSPLLRLAGLGALSVVGLSAVASAHPAPGQQAAVALGPVAGGGDGPQAAAASGGAVAGGANRSTASRPTTRALSTAGGGGATTDPLATSVAWYQSYARSQLTSIAGAFGSCEQEAGVGSSSTSSPTGSSATGSTSLSTAAGSVTSTTNGSAVSGAPAGDACEALSSAATAAADGTPAPDATVEQDWQSYLQDDVAFAQVAHAAAATPTPALHQEATADAQKAEKDLGVLQQLLGV